jgi:hypothetical protein
MQRVRAVTLWDYNRGDYRRYRTWRNPTKG